jgi:hypothetical protein
MMKDTSLLPYLYGLVKKPDGEPCVTMIMKVIPTLLKHLLLLLVENYILKNVLMLLIGMVKTLTYQLFMTLKLMELVLVKKKDSLIAQEMINSTITTVVILKTWLLDVDMNTMNQNQHLNQLSLISIGILLNGLKMELSLLLLLFGLEKNGVQYVMTILILMDQDLHKL